MEGEEKPQEAPTEGTNPEDAEKPEATPETKPEPKSKPEPTPEPEPKAVPESKPEPPADTKPEPKDKPAPNPELEALRAQVEAQAAALEQQKREAFNLLLDRAGVLEHYRDIVPVRNPYTKEGRKALQAWVDAHPEIVRVGNPTQRPDVDKMTGDLQNKPGAWLLADGGE